MSFLRASAFVLVLAGCSHEQVPPPPGRPLPWLDDAYIAFERAPDLDEEGSTDRWYWQNAVQISGDKIALRKTTVICQGGRILSSEGDGGSLSYSGFITATEQGSVANLSFVGCDGCIGAPAQTRAPGTFQLPISTLSPRSVRLGGVIYSKDQVPYPDRCPDTGVQPLIRTEAGD